jgi:branched-chain amino acid transport system substrate-binding protein
MGGSHEASHASHATAPAALAFGGPLLVARPARAAKQYGPGVTDSEIKIGNTSPYSGPLSNASPVPISMDAYFKMINAQGGVNERNHRSSDPCCRAAAGGDGRPSCRA